MTTPDILKSKVITIHLLSWVVGGMAFAFLAVTDLAAAMWLCMFAGLTALVSSVAVVPVAVIHLFQHRNESLIVRLQFVGVACMATLVLGGFIAFQIMTAGRH